jgi:hypothetical protein
MPNSGSFAIYRQDTLDPRWGAEGVAWAIAIGGYQDQQLALLRIAALSRFPLTIPDDGLDALGQTFVLPRFSGESNSSYRARLVAVFATYALGGTALAIIDSLQAWGGAGLDVYCLPIYQPPAPFWPESSATSWNEWYLFLGPGFGNTSIAPLVLGSWTLGATTGSILGSSMTPQQLAQIKSQILRWKFTPGLPIKICLQFSGAVGSPATATACPVYGMGKCLGEDWMTLGGFTLGGYQ